MLLDKYINTGTLYLVIGTTFIEYGVSSSGKWVADTVKRRSLPTDQSDVLNVAKLSSLITEIAGELDEQKRGTLPKFEHLRVLVADTWLSESRVPWSSSLSLNERQAKPYLLSQLAFEGFETNWDDTVRFMASYGAPPLVVAYPGSLLSALHHLVSGLNLHLVSVLPFSVAATHYFRKKSHFPVLGVLFDSMLSICDSSGSGLEIKSRVLSGDNVLASIEVEWNRIRCRESHLVNLGKLPLAIFSAQDEISTSKEGDLAALDMSSLKVQDISPALSLALNARDIYLPLDAVQSAPGFSALRWVAVCALLFIAGAMGLDAWQTNQQLKQIGSNIEAAISDDTSKRAMRPWTKQELEQLKSVNATIRQLNLPFSVFLKELQPPRDISVAILGLDIDTKNIAANTSRIRMVAEANTASEMVLYVSFLSNRNIFKEVRLLNHEVIKPGSNQTYRFNLELLWEQWS